MNRIFIPVLLTACVACGCARTVAPDEFLYTYRRGASPTYTKDGYKVRYTGTDGGYHYLEVRHDTLGKGAGPLLMHGTFRDQTLRCPTAQLPDDFPDDFEVLHKWTTIDEPSAMEPPSRTREYIRNYLAGAARRPDDWDR